MAKTLPAILACLALGTPAGAAELLPTGKEISPTAASGAIFQELNPQLASAPERRAGGASAIALSPDGKLLAILTSGFNAYYEPSGALSTEGSKEFLFLFDVTGPEPRQVQALTLPNAFPGLVWAPSSQRLYASAGKDDAVAEFVLEGGRLQAARTFPLGHKGCVGRPNSIGSCGPEVAGLALSPDGSRLLAANIENDSVSLVDLAAGKVIREQDLRPGVIDPAHHGEPGGTYPRAVAWTSPTQAFVASERDREVVALEVTPSGTRVARRIAVHGQPVALIANRQGNRLYVALDTTDAVAVIDIGSGKVLETIDVTSPREAYANPQRLGGGNTNALALTPDGHTLLASDGGENAVAVVRLGGLARGAVGPQGDDRSSTVGMVPTGWYPTGVVASKDGSAWYIINNKGPMGPNDGRCRTEPQGRYCKPVVQANTTQALAENGFAATLAANSYVNQLQHSGFLTMPAPGPQELARLTAQVAHNNRFDVSQETDADRQLFAQLSQHIKHVIYIIKENRTYDQMLGDLDYGNGDSRLTLFPERRTPNHHSLARNFVTLDNYFVSGEGSATGWDWSTAAQTTDLKDRMDQVVLGSSYKGENIPFPANTDRSIATGYATAAERIAIDPTTPADPDIVPGARFVYAPDGPGGEEGKGYIWDAVLRGGKTVRNWGFYGTGTPASTPIIRDPYAARQRVYWPKVPALVPYSDIYAYTWATIPDFWRVHEWKREFDEFAKSGTAPNLMLLQLSGDHFGNFDHAIDGVDTPETMMADNDYALGLVVAAVAMSPFADSTIVIAIEDDASDGADHVNAMRSVIFFAGPYVRQHALISRRYNTVNAVKTIEALLGVGSIGLNDELAAPMSEVFDLNQTSWTYQAIVPDILRSTRLPLPASEHASVEYPRRSAAYWTRAMKGQDFSEPDRIDTASFNRALWRGLKGSEPFPANLVRGGGDHDGD
jgi:DNA-binding beta-propeller fold protein YncE